MIVWRPLTDLGGGNRGGPVIMSSSHTDPEDQEMLEQQAVAWMVRLTSGDVTPTQQRQAETWRQQSPAHERAFQKAHRLWVGMEGLRGRSAVEPLRARGRVFPRVVLRWGAVAAALAFIVMGGFWRSGLVEEWLADYRTGTGEQRIIVLADGSRIHLNTKTVLSIRFTAAERLVELVTGEAAFTVAKDAVRPFTVRAGPGQATAVGTEFLVYRNQDRVTVTVTEGTVRVASEHSDRTLATVESRLIAGQRVSYTGAHGLLSSEPADPRLDTAWRRGRIVFEDTPLDTVVAEINRYRPGHIMAIGRTLKAQRVSGVFDLARLDEAIGTIQHTLHVKQIQLTSRYMILF